MDLRFALAMTSPRGTMSRAMQQTAGGKSEFAADDIKALLAVWQRDAGPGSHQLFATEWADAKSTIEVQATARRIAFAQAAKLVLKADSPVIRAKAIRICGLIAANDSVTPITAANRCKDCGGRGEQAGGKICPRCDGSGKLKRDGLAKALKAVGVDPASVSRHWRPLHDAVAHELATQLVDAEIRWSQLIRAERQN